jgi:amidase
MQRIARHQALKYAFDWRDEPLLRVRPGETFEIETWDAGAGYFKTPADKAIPALRPGFDRSPPQANPIGGTVDRRDFGRRYLLDRRRPETRPAG